MHRNLVFASGLLLSLVVADSPAIAADAAPVTIRGHVWLDANANGLHDPGEPGLVDVAVSDGVQVVRTGADGAYEIKVADDPVIPFQPSRVIALSWPSGHWPSSVSYRRFSEMKPADLKSTESVDFLLRKDEQKIPFTFAQGTDPHDGLGGDSTRLFRNEMGAMRDEVKLCIFTGDLGYAALDSADAEFIGIRNYTRAFPIPLFHCVGNHDVVGIHTPSWKKMDELSGNGTFTKYLGPIRWSFNYAGVHFVGLDWMKIVDGKLELGLPDVACDWLEADLAKLAPGTRVLVFAHCVDSEDGRFYDIARKHKVDMLICGHSHRNLDISRHGIKGVTTMNLRGPYRLFNVTDSGEQIINRCLGCKTADYHSKSCALFRAHESTHKAGTGAALTQHDVAADNSAAELNLAVANGTEILATIDPGTSRRCGLRFTPAAVGAKPLEVAFADNTLSAGAAQAPYVRRPDQPAYVVRVYVEGDTAKLYVNGRIQTDVPLGAAGPYKVAFFAEGGKATAQTVDAWVGK
ncbi:MAG: metallophosphoesterase [Planctomycetia bacterium]|nr:metallophosphoesterase [Planctomycetia bacterium]